MSQANNRPDCETLRALIPAYSVGATDPEETALVEKLLLECPEGAAELEDYLTLSEAMLYAAPPAQPPAALHDRLMEAVSAESQPTAQPPASLPAIMKPVGTSVKPAPAPVLLSAQPTRILRLNRYLAAAAAVAAALLILSNVYWVAQVNSLNQQQQTMTVLLRNQEDALTSLGTGKANHVQLVSTSGTSTNPLATVLWTPQSPAALIYTNNLPALAANQTYQLWFIQDSHPVSAGIFQLDQLGVGVLIFTLNQPMSAYSAVAISTEPAGGSDQPTTTPIAAAQLG